MDAYWLVAAGFFSSCLAGALGMGGGVLLMTLMSGLVPPQALLPVHAVTQLASNGSRALLGWRHIDWHLVPPVIAGGVLGAAVGGGVYQSLDLTWLPAIVGVFILLITWVKLPGVRGGSRASLGLLGFYQTGIGMVAGATGPLGAAVMLQFGKQRDWLVVNTAVYMSLNHVLRTVAFALLGFSFASWLPLIASLAVAVIAGSWVGTRLRRFIPERDFQRWFRWLVTLLALRMIVSNLL